MIPRHVFRAGAFEYTLRVMLTPQGAALVPHSNGADMAENAVEAFDAWHSDVENEARRSGRPVGFLCRGPLGGEWVPA